MDKRVVGILGGGQLGRMITEAAHLLNIQVAVLDVGNGPAKKINVSPNHVNGSFKDSEAIRKFAEKCDVLTVEIEHVNVDGLKDLDVAVQPGWRTIEIIQDKYIQKQHLHLNKILTAGTECTLEVFHFCHFCVFRQSLSCSDC